MINHDAQLAYESAVKELHNFCDKNTHLIPSVLNERYPVQIQFIPDRQMSIFPEENVDRNGELKDLTITVGLDTTITNTLAFDLSADLLKKLIKHAETVGLLYYQAFREEHDITGDIPGEEKNK